MLLTNAVRENIQLSLTTEQVEQLRQHFLLDQIHAAVLEATDFDKAVRDAIRRGMVPGAELRRYVFEKTGRLVPISGGAQAYYATNAECISMLTDYGVGIDAGTAAVIQIYAADVGVPADADAANTNTLLATLTCSATAFTSVADNTPGALATFAAITDDSSADATNTAAFFRISTQSAGTVVGQGTVGTATADLILNTVSITAGSTVSITAATIELEEGP